MYSIASTPVLNDSKLWATFLVMCGRSLYVHRQWLKWGLAGRREAQPHLIWLGPPLLRFQPNLVKNCHSQRECKIIEVCTQNGSWIVCCGQKLVTVEAQLLLEQSPGPRWELSAIPRASNWWVEESLPLPRVGRGLVPLPQEPLDLGIRPFGPCLWEPPPPPC